MRSSASRLRVVFIALVAALVLAEVAGQIYFRGHRGHWLMQDAAFASSTAIPYTMPVRDRRQYSLRPGFSDGLQNVDARGFRVSVPADRPGDRVVVVIGDSVPFGASVRDDETYPSVLARQLRADGRQLGVVNAGVASYNTQQSFDRLRIDVLRHFKPEQIAAVIFNATNDISLVDYNRGYYVPGMTWARGRNLVPLRPPWQRFALAYYASPADQRPAGPAVPYASRAAEDDAMLDHVRTNLREALGYWAQWKTPIILLPINPFYYQIRNLQKNGRLRVMDDVYHGRLTEMKDWDALTRRFNQLLEETAAEFPNVRFLETRAIFDDEDRDSAYDGYSHLSPAGHQLTAKILATAFPSDPR